MTSVSSHSTASTATTTSSQTSGLARGPAANAEKTAAVTAARERVEAAERDTTGSSGEPSARRVVGSAGAFAAADRDPSRSGQRRSGSYPQRPSAGLLHACQLPSAPLPNATVGSGSLQKGLFLPKRQRNQSLVNRAEVILVSGVSASRRLGGAASQPNAASGCKRSSSSLLSKRGKSLASQSPPALPHLTSSPGILPKRKSAILEPARTGAVSPYGHRLADAPETSALLAELEYLTRGPDTPTVEAKPDVGSTSTRQALGGSDMGCTVCPAPVQAMSSGSQAHQARITNGSRCPLSTDRRPRSASSRGTSNINRKRQSKSRVSIDIQTIPRETQNPGRKTPGAETQLVPPRHPGTRRSSEATTDVHGPPRPGRRDTHGNMQYPRYDRERVHRRVRAGPDVYVSGFRQGQSL